MTIARRSQRPSWQFRGILVAAILLLWPANGPVPGDAAADDLSVDRLVAVPTATPLIVSPVSDRFRHEVEIAARTVPTKVWRRLKQAGWQVRLAEFVVDAVPSLAADHPRGWPHDMSWKHVDGVNLPKQRLLVFAEKRQNRLGQIVQNLRVAGVLRHEVGHSFDLADGGPHRFLSSRPDFLEVYQRDMARMSANDRKAVSYYLQKGAAGRQETFAEAFAIFLGGGSDVPQQEQFIATFPHVMRWVDQLLEERVPAAEIAAVDRSRGRSNWKGAVAR